MDAKLVLDEKYYYLEVQHERIGNMVVGSSDHELSRIVNQPFKLSTKNCEAIKNGYDLDELAINHAEGNDNYITAENSFKVGVETILEILGDNKFSEDDMVNMFFLGRESLDKALVTEQEAKIIVKSKKQTEWDVEIVTEPMNLDEIREQGKGFLHCNTNKPKLDSNGCLILKRK